MKHCPHLCGRGRDYDIVVERELAQFLRALMKFIYPVAIIPAVFEIVASLKTVDRDCADVDSKIYRLHFGQYFQFDISTQLQFFYKCVQKMLVGLCRRLSGLWQRTWPNHLSLTPFDPVLIHSGFNDRRVDSLVETCAVRADCSWTSWVSWRRCSAATIHGSHVVFQESMGICNRWVTNRRGYYCVVDTSP